MLDSVEKSGCRSRVAVGFSGIKPGVAFAILAKELFILLFMMKRVFPILVRPLSSLPTSQRIAVAVGGAGAAATNQSKAGHSRSRERTFERSCWGPG